MTRKITDGVARIKLGLATELRLGNLDAERDWGFAGDYVEAMWLMLQQETPSDYVIATGETHSVREFVERRSRTRAWIRSATSSFDPAFMRPAEVDLLIGNPARARAELGWTPKTTFRELVEMMVDADLARLSTAARV